MVKRLKELAAAGTDTQLAETIKDSAQQIWLAGLGAFSKAQEEGAKVFEALVKEGRGIEARTRKMTEAGVGEVTGQMSKAAQTATARANAAWDKLEQVFEDRVARSLNRLGVPTNKDIKALTKRVEELNAAVAALNKKAKAPAKKVAAKKKAK